MYPGVRVRRTDFKNINPRLTAPRHPRARRLKETKAENARAASPRFGHSSAFASEPQLALETVPNLGLSRRVLRRIIGLPRTGEIRGARRTDGQNRRKSLHSFDQGRIQSRAHPGSLLQYDRLRATQKRGL